MGLMKRIREFLTRGSRYQFFEVGFHGDAYLLKVVEFLAEASDVFLETGTNVGSTLGYMARTYEQMECYSCEPDATAYRKAMANVGGYENVTIYKMGAVEFLEQMNRRTVRKKPTLFWLDAHGQGFQWPLKMEIEIITERWTDAFVLIDDFQVPGEPHFEFETAGGQICNFDHIADHLAQDNDYQIVYPSYTEKTSDHHPLTGWVLISFGKADLLRLLRSCSEFLRFKA